MFNLVEIDKRTSYPNDYVPIEPYVFYMQIANSSIADYWTSTFGADGTYNDVLYQINSVTIDNTTNLTAKTSYADMADDELSFYFDYDNQLMYINAGENINLAASSIASGVMYGYSDDTVHYFNNQEYIPIVLSIPSISQNTDPLEYGIISFSSGTVELANSITDDAFFFNGKENFYGNTIRILRGEDDQNYSDFTTVFSGYISNAKTSTTTETLTLGDNREKMAIDYPTEVFDVGIDDTDDNIIPDGYGDVIQAKAYPTIITTEAVVYKWATKATSIDSVYSYSEDEGLVSVFFGASTVHTLTDGYFYILNEYAYVDGDTTKGLKDIYVTGRMRDFDNPADIIADLNSNVLGIEYNDDNYDTTEWESEKTSLADVALYMDSSKSLYEWIEKLQAGSNIGFRYDDREKRTLRLDDKKRTEITFDDDTSTILPVDIRNSEMPVDQNNDLYASSVIVKYGYNLRTKTYSQVTNSDYYDDVIKEFRVEKIDTYETLLTSQTDAESKAALIAEDESTVRPLVKVTLESSKYKEPRIFDIVSATVNLLNQKSLTFNYNIEGDTTTSELVGDDEVLGEVQWSKVGGEVVFYGDFKGEVLGISHNIETDEVTLTLRDIGD